MQYVVPDVLNRSPSIAEIMRSSLEFSLFFFLFSKTICPFYISLTDLGVNIIHLRVYLDKRRLFLVRPTMPVKLAVQRPFLPVANNIYSMLFQFSILRLDDNGTEKQSKNRMKTTF